MPKGRPRPLDEQAAELDRRIAQIKAKKEKLKAARSKQQREEEEHRIRIAGVALRRSKGSWKDAAVRKFLDLNLIHDRERAVFGFDPFPADEKARRLTQVRELEDEWKRRENGEADSAPGRA